jgi:hypothetical protein
MERKRVDIRRKRARGFFSTYFKSYENNRKRKNHKNSNIGAKVVIQKIDELDNADKVNSEFVSVEDKVNRETEILMVTKSFILTRKFRTT